MKITYEPVSNNAYLRLIKIEDEPWRTVHISVFGKRPHFLTTCQTLAEWELFFQQYAYQAAKNYTLRRLSLQHLHSYQLRRLLQERLVLSNIIERVIDECTHSGYLDDQTWLESFIRRHKKRWGNQIIRYKLQAKGLPLELIDEVLEENNDPEQEKEAIKHLIETRYRLRDLKQPKERQKVIASLMRKGYKLDAILSTLHLIKASL